MNEITCLKCFQHNTWHMVCAQYTVVITTITTDACIDLFTGVLWEPRKKGVMAQPWSQGRFPGDES